MKQRLEPFVNLCGAGAPRLDRLEEYVVLMPESHRLDAVRKWEAVRDSQDWKSFSEQALAEKLFVLGYAAAMCEGLAE